MFKKTGQKIWNLVDQHLGYVFECYCAFEQFMTLLLGEGRPASELAGEYKRIDELEGLADRARRNLINAFLEGTLLPSTRKELMNITASMDKVANRSQNIACQLLCQNVDVPVPYRANLLAITRITKEQLIAMKKALKVLFDDYDQIIKDPSLIDVIEAKEHDVDRLEDETTVAIFSDSALELAEKSHLRYFLTRLCDISDLLEDIADQIQIIVILRKV
jgi:predicted phosphate transport protein (TIGR00153 family)